MAAFRKYGGTYCIRCSYKHVIVFLFSFCLIYIVICTILTHYADIVGATKHSAHYLTSKKSTIIQNSNSNKENVIHTMYSVGCDHMMMWQLQQSVTLDYSWFNVHQSGHLTRIVSGCNYAANNIREMSKTSIPMKADIHFLDDEELVNQCLTNYNSSSQNNKNNIFGLQWNWDYRFHIIFVPSFDDKVV